MARIWHQDKAFAVMCECLQWSVCDMLVVERGCASFVEVACLHALLRIRDSGTCWSWCASQYVSVCLHKFTSDVSPSPGHLVSRSTIASAHAALSLIAARHTPEVQLALYLIHHAPALAT